MSNTELREIYDKIKELSFQCVVLCRELGEIATLIRKNGIEYVPVELSLIAPFGTTKKANNRKQ